MACVAHKNDRAVGFAGFFNQTVDGTDDGVASIGLKVLESIHADLNVDDK